MDADQSVALLCEPGDVDGLVRQLVRIGIDRVAGWLAVEDFQQWRLAGGRTSSIERLSFAEATPPSKVSVWLDVRGAAEYAEGHVEGAINVAQGRLAAEYERIPQGRPLTVHCATGGRAALASAYLARRGFEVRYVDDDFAGWSQRSLQPVARVPR